MFPHENSQSKIELNFSKFSLEQLDTAKSVYMSGGRGYCTRRDHTARMDIEQLRRYYVTGHCGVLATVIHQLTGWPVYQIGTYVYPHTRLPFKVEGFFEEPARTIPGGWHQNSHHAFIRNPETGYYVDSYGSRQTWRQITKTYRRSFLNEYYEKIGVRRSKQIDAFRQRPEDYLICLLDHVDRMLPEFSALVAQWRAQEGIPQPEKKETNHGENLSLST